MRIARLGGLMPISSWLLLGLVAAAWYGYELKIARPAMTWMGEPRPTDPKNLYTWNRTLRNQAYMLGYSDWRANPLWVVYALTPPPAQAHPLRRPSHFSADWRGLKRVHPADFHESGYDRGHMAPSHAIGLDYGAEAMTETFLLTNITPQKTSLNEKIWERLEALEIDEFAKQFGKVWVFTGPVFDPPSERLKTAKAVEIPDAFYKIIVAPEAKRVLAFIIPQTVRGDEPLDHYLTSVDSIEKRTGLDFFPELEDGEENRLEASIDPIPWHLQELAHQPRHRHKPKNREAEETRHE